MAATAVDQCDHGKQYKAANDPCDEGYGFMICEDEPTARPPGGRPNHPVNLCLECLQSIFEPPPGLDFKRTIDNRVGELIYQLDHTGPNWVSTGHVAVRGGQPALPNTQALLCEHCTELETSHWRRCEIDEGYAQQAMYGKSQYAEDGHTNTCVCRKKYMMHKTYCVTCNRDALDDRQLTALRNKTFLENLGFSSEGHRRRITDDVKQYRHNHQMNSLPCRCGRNLTQGTINAIAPAPKATFCLACNGVKIWRQNVRETRYPVRSTRALLSSTTDLYPLKHVTGNHENDVNPALGYGTINRGY